MYPKQNIGAVLFRASIACINLTRLAIPDKEALPGRDDYDAEEPCCPGAAGGAGRFAGLASGLSREGGAGDQANCQFYSRVVLDS